MCIVTPCNEEKLDHVDLLNSVRQVVQLIRRIVIFIRDFGIRRFVGGLIDLLRKIDRSRCWACMVIEDGVLTPSISGTRLQTFIKLRLPMP